MISAFGKRLAQAREHAGLTQQELADCIPMAQSTLASAEKSGDGSRLTAQLAHHCGVNAYWLATGDGDMLAGMPTPLPRASASTPDMAQALPVVIDSLAAMPAQRWPSVRGQLDQLATHPEARDDVLDELLLLLQAPPSKRAAFG